MRGSGKVLKEANQLAVIKNQETVAQGYYSRICTAYASVLFSALLLAVGLAVHFWLFSFLIAVIACQFLISTWLVGDFHARRRSALGAYVIGHKSNYLTILASIDFLLVFGFLLVSFLLFDGINILVAILAILISRQLFSNVSSLALDASHLMASRLTIDALVFRDRQLIRKPPAHEKDLHGQFERSVRTARIAQLLGVDEHDRARAHASRLHNTARELRNDQFSAANPGHP
jgi:hypothetical protein